MDLYILDPLLRRVTLVDEFITCIWTERFDEYGDFELHVHSTPDNRARFFEDVLLACSESNYVMRIQTIEDLLDDENRPTLIIKGPSIEELMDDRVAFGVLDDLTTVPTWDITDPPADIARKVFQDICITGILATEDIIPMVTMGSFLPADTIPEPVDDVTVNISPQPVGDVIKTIVKAASLGFRMVRQDDPPQLWFDIYSGSDRTSSQTALPAVIFTPALDNLQDTTELNTNAGFKNVAYVFSPAGFQMVYAPSADPEVDGYERRVLVVIADDITSAHPDVTSALIRRGEEELAKHQAIQAFDGKIDSHSNLRYGEHYFLGDVVEMRSRDGATNIMRVTEQIFVQDETGERAYPTLSINKFIAPGSWLAWKNDQMWSELGAEEWADLP
jgi:hypothetical protein